MKIDHSLIKNDSSIFSLYLEAIKALHLDNEKHMKKILEQILDSIPELKIKHPHIQNHKSNDFKQAFSDFSLSFKAAHENSKKIYLMKCPMANSDKGGYWLSGKPEVNNLILEGIC